MGDRGGDAVVGERDRAALGRELTPDERLLQAGALGLQGVELAVVEQAAQHGVAVGPEELGHRVDLPCGVDGGFHIPWTVRTAVALTVAVP